MRVLFLSTNPNLGSTTRTLQSWLLLGRQDSLNGRVVVQRNGDFARWLKDHQITYTVNSMPAPRWRWPLPCLWQGWKLARWCNPPNVDIIHCNEHDVYPFGLLMRLILRRPLVCHVRFRIDREFSQWAFTGRRRPEALLWTSNQQREDCADAIEGIVPKERQHVVRLGLDLEIFGKQTNGRSLTRQGWGVAEDEIVIGMASAIRPRKRIEDFVKIIAQLSKDNQRVIGVLAGDIVAGQGDERYREQILEKIKSTGLGRRLRWLGNLEPIEPFLHAIDIFVSTSEYETFGMSVCEAMACSRAVAAYRGGSVHEVIGDTGRVVETGDREGLAQVVAELIEDAELRRSLGHSARQRVALHFDPAKSLKQLQEIYQRLRSSSEVVST